MVATIPANAARQMKGEIWLRSRIEGQPLKGQYVDDRKDRPTARVADMQTSFLEFASLTGAALFAVGDGSRLMPLG